MNIYNNEVVKFEIEILEKLKNKLYVITDLKIRSNSKAFIELKKLIKDIDSEILVLSQDIDDENFIYSQIKIDTFTLKELISLKRELKIDTVSELLELLVSSYKEIFLIDSFVEVQPYVLDKNEQKNLNKTDFYISTSSKDSDKISDKILYKIDDLIIFDNKEYLDLKNFKSYTFINEDFYISPLYTLQDIDLFISIWKSNN